MSNLHRRLRCVPDHSHNRLRAHRHENQEPQVPYQIHHGQDLTTSNSANPSLSMSFVAEVSVKNPNFGRYKYDQTSISFIYEGTQVGDAVVPKATARTKATRKEIVSGAVKTVNSNLASDISAGSVTLSTYSKINGKVYLMNMIKKKKSAEMKCTMVVHLSSKQVQDIKCN
ncbi:hypothetical protein ACLB2K_075689 [Fragaria x ananassa]